jgi:Leucine-rich repeat (LRR) protein
MEEEMAVSDLELIKQLEHELGFTLEVQEYEKIHEYNYRGFTVDKNNQVIGLNLDEIILDPVPVSLPSFRHLKKLRLSDNKLKDFSFLLRLSDLTLLILRKNQITDISFLQSLDKLIHLDLTYNQIKDISFLQGLNKLEKLFLGYNQIVDISFLQGLNNIAWLALWDNQITDISCLRELNKLKALDLRNNKIEELPGAIFELGLEIDMDHEFECFQKIYLHGNPLG